MNAAQLCELLQGELEGDGEKKINGPSQIDKGRPGTVTFLANPKYEEFAYTTPASVIIVPKDFVPKIPLSPVLIRVENVYGAMMFLIEQFGKNGIPDRGISDFAVIHPTCQINAEVSIGAYSVLEANVIVGNRCTIYPGVIIGHDTVIADDVILYPGVKIYPNTQIGNRCIIHANTVIGCDGFGYRPDESGRYQKITHLGIVVLEDDVEIRANSVIDRGTLSVTRIGEGTKIDNLVQIAHNVTIGKHTAIAAQTGIAGSATIGSFTRIGGQAGIAGHINLADKLEIQGQSGVNTGKYPEGSKLMGTPAFPFQEYLKSYIIFKSLPDYIRRIEELERSMSAGKKHDP